MGFILEHVEYPEGILRQYKKFLKNETGRLFITVPNARGLHRRIGYEAGLLEDIYAFNAYDKKAGHKRYYDLETIQSLVERVGLHIHRCEGIFLKPITTAQINKLELPGEVLVGMLKVGVEYPELSNYILIEAGIK